jgi:hypothetical protein
VFLRAIKPPPPVVAPLPAAPATDELPQAVATAALESASAPELPASPDPAQLEEQRTLAIEFASKDPAGAALILTQWLASADEPKPEASSEAA